MMRLGPSFYQKILIIICSFIVNLNSAAILADNWDEKRYEEQNDFDCTLQPACFNFLAEIANGEPIFQLGWFTATQGKSQHVDIEGLIGDDFEVNHSSDQNLLVGIGYYFNWLATSVVRMQYGINAFYLGSTEVKGHVIQEDLFTNLSYRYSCTNYPIYFSAKALIPCGMCDDYDIVIDLGIGPNIVNTHSFKEKSLDGGITIPDHIFSGKNTVVFSATAGLGWRINHIWENHSLEIGYRFFYLGQGELKKVNNQVKNTLRTGNGYANALVISISI